MTTLLNRVGELRQPRVLLKAAVILVLGTWVVLPNFARAQLPADDLAAVSVAGVVPAESQQILNAAARALTKASFPTSPDLQIGGSLDNRQAFVEGVGDMVVSGVPFTAEESAQLAKSGREVVQAPLNAVGLGLMGFVAPLTTFPVGCEEADNCVENIKLYDGPIRFTPSVVASWLFEQGSAWRSPEFRDTLNLGANEFFQPPIYPPRPLVRTDPDSSNMYLEDYVARTQPEVRRKALTGFPGASPDQPVTETWPFSTTSSRLGMDNAVSQVREGLDPSSTVLSFGGTITAGSVALVKESFELNLERPKGERIPLFRVQLRNAAGEWVLPTTKSISVAVAAGEGIPNTGAVGSAVPGAYPITWVNSLYAPTKGLGPAKANAIAALIRWQVSVGQKATELEGQGDGQLTPKMIERSLAAADSVVRSNCAQVKGVVAESTDAGGTAPPGGFPGLGKVSFCKNATLPVPTTIAPPVAPNGGTEEVAETPISELVDVSSSDEVIDLPPDPEVLAESSLSGEISGDVSSIETTFDGATSPTDSGVTGSSSGGGNFGSGAVATQQSMPLPVPGQSLPPLDRAMTLGVGALAYLGIRNLKKRSG